MPLENFPRSDAFQHLDNLCRAFHRNGLEQKMNMVPVRADLKKMNFVPLFHFQTNLYQSLIHRLVKDHLAIFCRTDKMVQQYRNIVRFVYIFALTHKQIYHLRCKQRGNKLPRCKHTRYLEEESLSLKTLGFQTFLFGRSKLRGIKPSEIKIRVPEQKASKFLDETKG